MEPKIVVDERCGVDLDRPPLQRLLERASSIEPGPDAASARAFANDLLVFDRGAGLRAEIRKLELVGEPIDDVGNLAFEQQPEIAAVLAALAFAAAAVDGCVRRTQRVAGFGLALSRPGLLAGIREAKARVLEKPDRYLDGARVRLGHVIAVGEQIDQLLPDRLAHLLIVTQPVARPAREKLVPGRFHSEANAAPPRPARLPARRRGCA